MQFMLFIRMVFASWRANLTEKEHFGMSRTDSQAMVLCQTVLIQQALLLKAYTWITVESIRANTQNQQIGGNMYHSAWGEKKPQNHKTNPKLKIISL